MQSILLHICDEDIPYLPRIKNIVQRSARVPITKVKPSTITEMLLLAKEKDCKQIATTYQPLLQLLVDTKRKASLDDYAGSIIEKSGVEFLILNPLEHLVSTSAGTFLFERYLSKFLHPERWFQFPEFSWHLFDPARTDEIIDIAADSSFIAIDIETGHEQERIITCIGFTCITIERGSYKHFTFVVPFNDEYNVAFAKVICQLAVGKVFQNGKYDNSYLLRYGIAVSSYMGDTLNLFHSWYSELPKRLDFITSFMLRKFQFWKNESDTTDTLQYYAYNAKDSFVTAINFLALLNELPDWAWVNYFKEFPLVFPCILAEMTGLKRDQDAAAKEEARFKIELEAQLLSIRKLVGHPNFNPSSPKQVFNLMKALGSGDLTGSGKIPMDKFNFRHPLNYRIGAAITKYRSDRKLAGTYLRDEDPKDGTTKTWNGRIFYALNPHGTDTSRLASTESHFWCGWQIQNIPRDREDISIRSTIISDSGFYFGEADYAQNEARGTAYLSGDLKLIAAVDDETKDFHGTNASAFFGLPYDRIIDSKYDEELGEWIHKVLDKPVRQVSKNTNHGSNYNMGAQVLLDTMGIKNVLRAQEILKLPKSWTLIQITQYLLNGFAETYATVKGPWYGKVMQDVVTTHKLVGPTGWTRYCFGNPTSNKRDLNRYVAHPPQSLAAQVLNKAYMRVFYEVALPYPKQFKLGPQIHDSILFQYKKGWKHLAFKVKECMNIATDVVDTFGIKRKLVVPVDLKGESDRWSDLVAMKKLEILSA